VGQHMGGSKISTSGVVVWVWSKSEIGIICVMVVQSPLKYIDKKTNFLP
jgi:hypothetical protein